MLEQSITGADVFAPPARRAATPATATAPQSRLNQDGLPEDPHDLAFAEEVLHRQLQTCRSLAQCVDECVDLCSKAGSGLQRHSIETDGSLSMQLASEDPETARAGRGLLLAFQALGATLISIAAVLSTEVVAPLYRLQRDAEVEHQRHKAEMQVLKQNEKATTSALLESQQKKDQVSSELQQAVAERTLREKKKGMKWLVRPNLKKAEVRVQQKAYSQTVVVEELASRTDQATMARLQAEAGIETWKNSMNRVEEQRRELLLDVLGCSSRAYEEAASTLAKSSASLRKDQRSMSRGGLDARMEKSRSRSSSSSSKRTGQVSPTAGLSGGKLGMLSQEYLANPFDDEDEPSPCESRRGKKESLPPVDPAETLPSGDGMISGAQIGEEIQKAQEEVRLLEGPISRSSERAIEPCSAPDANDSESSYGGEGITEGSHMCPSVSPGTKSLIKISTDSGPGIENSSKSDEQAGNPFDCSDGPSSPENESMPHPAFKAFGYDSHESRKDACEPSKNDPANTGATTEQFNPFDSSESDDAGSVDVHVPTGEGEERTVTHTPPLNNGSVSTQVCGGPAAEGEVGFEKPSDVPEQSCQVRDFDTEEGRSASLGTGSFNAVPVSSAELSKVVATSDDEGSVDKVLKANAFNTQSSGHGICPLGMSLSPNYHTPAEISHSDSGRDGGNASDASRIASVDHLTSLTGTPASASKMKADETMTRNPFDGSESDEDGSSCVFNAGAPQPVTSDSSTAVCNRESVVAAAAEEKVTKALTGKLRCDQDNAGIHRTEAEGCKQTSEDFGFESANESAKEDL